MVYEDDNIKIISLSKRYLKKLYLYRIILKEEIDYFFKFNKLFKGIFSSEKCDFVIHLVDIYNNSIKMARYSPLFKIKQDNDKKILYFYTDLAPNIIKSNIIMKDIESIRYSLFEDNKYIFGEIVHYNEIIDKTLDNHFENQICKSIIEKKVCFVSSKWELIKISKEYTKKRKDDGKWKKLNCLCVNFS